MTTKTSTNGHANRAAFLAERQLGDPSEEQIEAACRRIQSGWSARKRFARKVTKSLA